MNKNQYMADRVAKSLLQAALGVAVGTVGIIFVVMALSALPIGAFFFGILGNCLVIIALIILITIKG